MKIPTNAQYENQKKEIFKIKPLESHFLTTKEGLIVKKFWIQNIIIKETGKELWYKDEYIKFHQPNFGGYNNNGGKGEVYIFPFGEAYFVLQRMCYK